ncbi:transglutaminase-like domain-containing protein [Parvibaculum sp.]|uniref:SirB1 family protein n=1 Tax=Parvibaculum sp. TaxID=2024848 RepID=UPI00320D2A69
MGKADADIEAVLRAAGETPDDALDIAHLALAFAALDRPGVSLAPYEEHLKELVRSLRTSLGSDLARGGESAEVIAGALAGMVAGRYLYRGDSATYDDPQNANLMHVIDRRKGLPVTLGILYLHVGQALGLDIHGLNFPGHFVLRLRVGQSAAIVDPFNRGDILSSADLLRLLRSIEGEEAKLTPDVHAPVGPRDILLRLQNNILSRAIRANDLDRARGVVSRMIWLAPRRAGLHFELGRIEVHAGHMGAAAEAFETCRSMASGEGEMRIAGMAEEALRRLKARLN